MGQTCCVFHSSPATARRRPLELLLLAILYLLPRCVEAAGPIRYEIDLRAPDSHLARVTMDVPDANEDTQIQFPAWNCLYQIRDFVKNVEHVAADCDGQPVGMERADTNTWRGPSHSCRDLKIHYGVYADADGPFDSALDEHHAFLNLAMVLFYLPRDRQRFVQVTFRIPAGWKLATFLEGDGEEFAAPNYDALVDSPVEAGHFEEFAFQQEFAARGAPTTAARRATIRLIIDADRGDYSPGRILDSIQRLTNEEVRTMQDLPFSRYTFLLHFLHDGGSTGGMEHHDGTAISLLASSLRGDEGSLESVAAHELFHAWNVKRIRPQSLEPVDYVHGNDTSDLWFCEGVTNTYAQLVLLRAGLIDRETFYSRMADAIELLQSRSARGFQSAEMSGREAWLEKYPEYNRQERSISYYNKGELLGYLLDLGIRHASANRASLDDVMRGLNRDFAQAGRFYTAADVQAIITRIAPAFDAGKFWADYVQGTMEFDYPAYFGYAGLHLTTNTEELAVPGFSASRNAGGLLQVDSVESGSGAELSGLQPGDLLIMANGDLLTSPADAVLPNWRPGQAVELQIARQGKTLYLKFRTGVNHRTSFQIEEDSRADAAQLQVREGWLKGITDSNSGTR